VNCNKGANRSFEKKNKGANNTTQHTRVPKSWTDAKGVLNSFTDLLLVCANADQCTDENDMGKWQHLSVVYIRLFLKRKGKKSVVHIRRAPTDTWIIPESSVQQTERSSSMRQRHTP
jgi:hypothetical protein